MFSLTGRLEPVPVPVTALMPDQEWHGIVMEEAKNPKLKAKEKEFLFWIVVAATFVFMGNRPF